MPPRRPPVRALAPWVRADLGWPIPSRQHSCPQRWTAIAGKMQHYFMYQRDTFLAHYHKRSNVECTFSMIKRKFGDSLRSESEAGQLNEIMCKVIARNVRLRMATISDLGFEMPNFAPRPAEALAG